MQVKLCDMTACGQSDHICSAASNNDTVSDSAS